MLGWGLYGFIISSPSDQYQYNRRGRGVSRTKPCLFRIELLRWSLKKSGLKNTIFTDRAILGQYPGWIKRLSVNWLMTYIICSRCPLTGHKYLPTYSPRCPYFRSYRSPLRPKPYASRLFTPATGSRAQWFQLVLPNTQVRRLSFSTLNPNVYRVAKDKAISPWTEFIQLLTASLDFPMRRNR